MTGIFLTKYGDVTEIFNTLLMIICDKSSDDTTIAKIKQKILFRLMNVRIGPGLASALQYNLCNTWTKIHIMMLIHADVNDTDTMNATSIIS